MIKINTSFIVPLYTESESLSRLYEEITRVMSPLQKEYEIIFVDDGSTDNSSSVLEELRQKDQRVKLIQLRRNFGKTAALSAGFKLASGEVIFTMDADLQDNPEDLPLFLKKLEEGYDIVCGWRRKRRDNSFKKLSSHVFNWFVSLSSGLKIHDFNCGFKCYRKKVAESLKLYGDMHRYIPVLAAAKGFKVAEVEVNHRPRIFGKSKYGSGRLLSGLFDYFTVIFITRYLYRPLHFFGLGGLMVSAAGFVICLYLSILWFMGQRPIGNRPLLLLGAMLIILGIQLFSVGFIGEMIIAKSGEEKEEIISRKIG